VLHRRFDDGVGLFQPIHRCRVKALVGHLSARPLSQACAPALISLPTPTWFPHVLQIIRWMREFGPPMKCSLPASPGYGDRAAQLAALCSTPACGRLTARAGNPHHWLRSLTAKLAVTSRCSTAENANNSGLQTVPILQYGCKWANLSEIFFGRRILFSVPAPWLVQAPPTRDFSRA
jgi:hypothetical protein